MRTRLRLVTEERDAHAREARVAWDWAETLADTNTRLSIKNLALAVELDVRNLQTDNVVPDAKRLTPALVRFTTESGAIYLLRDDGTDARLLRMEGPLNPWIRHDNGEWLTVVGPYRLVVGESATFLLEGDVVRETTPVLAIDVVSP